MNYDEFAFLNRQLASMLQSGIPLEGALHQLCATMQAGTLRAELGELEADLAKGLPLREALPKRRLPEFYLRMLRVGAQGNDLPGMLTMLADYYQRRQGLWTRLKGLMVYPAMVLLAALGLSVLITCLYSTLMESLAVEVWFGDVLNGSVPVALWLPVVWLAVISLAAAAAVALPQSREWLRWRLPGFKEASLCQFASTMKLLLQNGGELGQALGFIREMEPGTATGAELERWQQRLAAGQGKFSDLAAGGKVFPRLFVWLVGQSGEDLAGGFGRAAEIYYERARHRVEMLLYGALPVTVLMLGLLIFVQANSMVRILVQVMNAIGGDSGSFGGS